MRMTEYVQLKCFIAGLLLVLFFGNNAALAQTDKPTLVWKGCSITKKAFMLECAKAYEKKTGIHIELIGGGATLGIRSTVAGDADIGGTCRPCRPDIFPKEEGGCFLIPVAWDAICFITHPSNPVDTITSLQVKDIMTGRITNWQKLGGPDESIRLIYRRQTEQGKFSGVGYMTRKLVFQGQNPDYAEKGLVFRDSGLIERNVETMKWSFAADGFSSARKRKVKILSVVGMSCDKENIQQGRYPYFRPLYLVTKGEPTGEIKDFIDWILGDEGQAVISGQGTVNLKEGIGLTEKFSSWEQQELIIKRK